MANILVRKPERLDDLLEMDEIIYYKSIEDQIFKNRSMKVYDWSKGMHILDGDIPIPNDHIICDICNWNIALNKPEKIPLLVKIDKITSEGVVKKALCQKCVNKYYPTLICIGKP